MQAQLGNASVSKPRRKGVRLAVVVGLSVFFAFVFELGTLVGAPISSPCNLSDWNAGRVLIYFFLALPLSVFLVFNNWKRSLARFGAFLEAEDGARMVRWARRVLIGSVVLVIVTLLVGAVCFMARNTQPGPYQLFAVCIAVVIMAFYAARKKLARRVERVVLVILLASGFLFATMVPQYTHASWDDHIHYDRTVAASYLLDPEYTPADQMLVYREFNDVASWSRYPGWDGYHDPYDLANQSEIYQKINNAANLEEDSVRMEGPTTLRGVSITEYYLVAYIPGAIALWFARLFSVPATVAFMLGRIANLLCYAFVVYFAMRRLKSGKLIMAACALIPEAVFLASSYSYDFWLTAFVMLGFAYFIGELQRPDEPLTWKRFGIMVGAFLIGLGPKAIYVPIAAMLLFMPRKKFAKVSVPASAASDPAPAASAPTAAASEAAVCETAFCKTAALPSSNSTPRWRTLTQTKYVIVMLLSATFVLLTFLLPMVIGGPGDGDSRGGDVNPSYQIAFILSQPVAFADIFFDFFRWYVCPEEAHHVLVDFCGVETSFIDAILLLLLPLVAIFDRRACDAHYATHAKRISMWLLVFLTIVLMATALFISFTPVDAGRINGMQGRYLIPLLYPLFAMSINLKTAGRLGQRWFGDSEKRYAVMCYVVLGLCCLVLFLGIYDAIIEQYGRISGAPMLDLPEWLSPDNWTWLENLPWRSWW